jgi:hypothetical protein
MLSVQWLIEPCLLGVLIVSLKWRLTSWAHFRFNFNSFLGIVLKECDFGAQRESNRDHRVQRSRCQVGSSTVRWYFRTQSSSSINVYGLCSNIWWLWCWTQAKAAEAFRKWTGIGQKGHFCIWPMTPLPPPPRSAAPELRCMHVQIFRGCYSIPGKLKTYLSAVGKSTLLGMCR